ncbi:hypothetical protein BGZ70_002128 [Mortierella alpina]|uniref:Uncharacterized protein n=1 Tax=Mortierella alpina TaxID=64518 RepID=A0A9P6LXH5_MORAP|nr:hypothetical protein BGZ70_002128 [Mortierella alpina]
MKLYIPALVLVCTSYCHARQFPLASLDNLGCQKIAERFPKTNSDLVQKLIDVHGTKVEHATGMKHYKLDKSPNRLWRVAAMDHCEIEIGPPSAIGHALYCPRESPTPCTLGATYKDSQSFRDEIGFHTEFSIESGGGLPGVFEAKSTITFGTSYTYSKEFSHGLELSYVFPVEPGRVCTPTQVAYRQRCTGTVWEVRNDSWGWTCPELAANIDFNDKHRWFVLEGQDQWFHYVHYRGNLPPQLYTVRSKNVFRPRSCSDVPEKIQVRTLDYMQSDTNAKNPVEFDNGKSISAITCVY